jgi:uncharacterized protein (DUF1778 family)
MSRAADYSERRKRCQRAADPVLVGLTEAEGAKLSRAAAVCKTPRATFIREAALEVAEDVLAKKGGKR